FPTLLAGGVPHGSGFLVNSHKVETRRHYSVASTRHAGIDDAPERELEHEIPYSEAPLGRFHEVDTAQPGLCQRMVVRKFEDRHQRATLRPLERAGPYPERLTTVTGSSLGLLQSRRPVAIVLRTPKRSRRMTRVADTSRGPPCRYRLPSPRRACVNVKSTLVLVAQGSRIYRSRTTSGPLGGRKSC